MEVEDRPPHYWGMVGKWKEPVARVKGCPGERKALIAERYSQMKVSEQNLRKTLSVESGWSPEIEATGSEEAGAWWEWPLPYLAGGLQLALLCAHPQGHLDWIPDESRPCQGVSSEICRIHEEQAVAKSPGARWAGQARRVSAPAAHGPAQSPF